MTFADIADYLPKEQQSSVTKSYKQSVSHSKGRIRDARSNPIDRSSVIDRLGSEKEKNYVLKYFILSPLDGRCVVRWVCFADSVLQDNTSTLEDRKWAKVILQANEGFYDMDTYGEWHHLVPLCMFGSFLDPANYVRLPPGLHVRVHAALCHFFPSYKSLQYALNHMLNQKDSISEQLSGDELAAFLEAVEKNEQVYATARIEAAARTYVFTTAVTESTEHKRLAKQRAELPNAGVPLFSGEYSQEEVDLFIKNNPGAIFEHYPIIEQTKERKCNAIYKDAIECVPRLSDILVGFHHTHTKYQLGNKMLQDVTKNRFDEYKESSIQNKTTIYNQIVSQMQLEGRRFLTIKTVKEQIRFFEVCSKTAREKVANHFWNLQAKYKGRKSTTPTVTEAGFPCNTGSWTSEERNLFLQGIELHGQLDWKKVAGIVKSRTAVQIRSYAQNYNKMLAKAQQNEDVGSSNTLPKRTEKRRAKYAEEKTEINEKRRATYATDKTEINQKIRARYAAKRTEREEDERSQYQSRYGTGN